MIKYVPFLKLKSNEIMALKELNEDLREGITPFFDYARREKSDRASSEEAHFVDTATRLAKSLKANAGFLAELYLDNFDLENGLTVNGEHNYLYLLSQFSGSNIIPVVGIDRIAGHTKAVTDLKQNEVLGSDVLAVRITSDDFEDYDSVKDEIFDQLGEVFGLFEGLDLVLDCRVCANLDPIELSTQIVNFIKAFTDDYPVRRVIVTGSSLPASIADVAAVSTEEIIDRVEVEIFRHVIEGLNFEYDVAFGDYATVSPNYSDAAIPTYAMRNVTAPKIIYTYDDQHFVKRGTALATHPLGNGQYAGLLAQLVSKPFFRMDNSWGDKYLVEKSKGEGSDATPGTMVKPLCNSHITYICQQLNDEI